MQNGPSVSDANDLLFSAASSGDLIELHRAIGLGADVNAKNALGLTAVMLATNNEHFGLLNILVHDYKADPQVPDNAGQSALVREGAAGHASGVRALTFLGATFTPEAFPKLSSPIQRAASAGVLFQEKKTREIEELVKIMTECNFQNMLSRLIAEFATHCNIATFTQEKADALLNDTQKPGLLLVKQKLQNSVEPAAQKPHDAQILPAQPGKYAPKPFKSCACAIM